MKKYLILFGKLVVLCAMFLLSGIQPLFAQSAKLHTLNFKKAKELKEFFSYKEGAPVIVAGHRGGYAAGYVENTIEGMENVLKFMPAFFEIDPRITKDSVIVLMHDGTLDRVSTSKGRVMNYTYEELKSVKLKDHLGNVTDCKIPTLEETIIWSKGKTIINLDKKDVPLAMIAALIKKHKAERWVMLTVHSGAQARYYYDRFPEIMLSAHIRNQKEFEDMEISGVPWSNMIAYVGYTIDAKNKAICQKLHDRGVRCMIGLAPTADLLPTSEEREAEYRKEIEKKPDIIESNIPTEIWKVLQSQ